MASKMGYPERLSIFSSATLNGKDDDYDDLSSPADLLEDGALRRGGASPIFSRESYGLLAQYAAVGLIYGTLPQLVYPFLTVYLNLDGTTTTSATALLSIPWSLKVFIGMLTDNVPVFGYRRRPYMVFGWVLCAVCLFAMGVMHQPASYWATPADRKRASNLTESQYAEFGVKFNPDAINSGSSYVVLMMFASLGYVIADVAADAVVVEYAQREPESIRGRTQTAIYSVRTVFNIVAQAILAFFLNGPEYGGDFSFSLSVSSLMLILAIVCVPVIPMTWFFIRETRYESRGFKVYIATLWDALKSRAFYQVIAYSFFSGVLSQITYVASLPITNVWLHASPLTVNVTSILGSLVMVFTLIGTGFYGLQWNWRVVIAITMVAVVAIDVVVTMLTVWDHVRTAWFWLGVPIVEQVPQSIGWLVSTFVVVELAGEGNEGACYGLLTTVMNLSQPFASTITKNLNAGFAVWNDDLQADTHHVRTDVTITIMISYACKLLSLALLPMLPRQKAETQDLKRHGGSSRLLGGITIFYCLFALAWSIMTNLFAIYKDTKCLAITGGCKE